MREASSMISFITHDAFFLSTLTGLKSCSFNADLTLGKDKNYMVPDQVNMVYTGMIFTGFFLFSRVNTRHHHDLYCILGHFGNSHTKQ